MVGRPLTPVLVVDLDGTLVRGNTLRIALRILLRRGNPAARIKVATLMVLRWFRLVSHEYMKYRALPLLLGDKDMTGEFVSAVKSQFNHAVLDVINEYRRSGCEVLLATAAASQYVPLIWDGAFVASPDDGPDLRGYYKVAAVTEWLKTYGADIAGFITDHVSDLPLAQYAHALGAPVYLVDPDATTWRAFSPIPVRIIRASASLSRQEHP